MTTNNYSLFDLFEDIFLDMDGFLNTIHYQPMYPVTFPPCDIYFKDETKDILFEFAVAGIPKESIDVSVEGDYLQLKIEKVDRRKEGYKQTQKGIKSSSVSQRFYVPSSKYTFNDIKVNLRDGILSVHIPAKEEMKRKLITIE